MITNDDVRDLNRNFYYVEEAQKFSKKCWLITKISLCFQIFLGISVVIATIAYRDEKLSKRVATWIGIGFAIASVITISLVFFSIIIERKIPDIREKIEIFIFKNGYEMHLPPSIDVNAKNIFDNKFKKHAARLKVLNIDICNGNLTKEKINKLFETFKNLDFLHVRNRENLPHDLTGFLWTGNYIEDFNASDTANRPGDFIHFAHTKMKEKLLEMILEKSKG